MIAASSPGGSLFGWLILSLIGVQFGQTILLERYQIASGSMAPALLGRHGHTQCAECRREFDIGLDRPPIDHQPAVCPECGATGVEIESLPAREGDRVWIDRTAFLWRTPRRWEIVAFRSPIHSAQVHVKRVVGLPGEAVQVRDGDVYINGSIPERSLDQLREMSVLVHDANRAPLVDTGHGPRWRPQIIATAWRRLDSGAWTYGSMQWPDDPLLFENRERVPGDAAQSQLAPLCDRDGYNQTQTIRTWHPVEDVWLRKVGTLSRPLTWLDAWLIRLKVFPISTQVPTEWVEAHVDDRHELWINRVRSNYSPTPAQPSAESLFKIYHGELDLLQVWRDLYYTTPIGLENQPGLATPRKLGPDEYFVLGDNSQIAVDSRYPQFGPVSAKALVGKVLRRKK